MLPIDDYQLELQTYVEKNQVLLSSFASRSIFVSGAAGLIGSYLIDLILKATEKVGYSKIDKATMNISKLEALGWSAIHHLETGIPRTVKYVRELWA